MPATASRACGYLRTNVLSARPDLKKYTALRFRHEVKRHPNAAGPGAEQVVVMQYLHTLGSAKTFMPDPFPIKSSQGHAGSRRSSTLIRSGVLTLPPRRFHGACPQRMR
jgi:hypothetical protein